MYLTGRRVYFLFLMCAFCPYVEAVTTTHYLAITNRTLSIPQTEEHYKRAAVLRWGCRGPASPPVWPCSSRRHTRSPDAPSYLWSETAHTVWMFYCRDFMYSCRYFNVSNLLYFSFTHRNRADKTTLIVSVKTVHTLLVFDYKYVEFKPGPDWACTVTSKQTRNIRRCGHHCLSVLQWEQQVTLLLLLKYTPTVEC